VQGYLIAILYLLVLLRDFGTENIDDSHQAIDQNGNPGELEVISPGPVPTSQERHQRKNHNVNARKHGKELDEPLLVRTQFHANS